MPNDIQPLQDRVQIVNANGTPTPFFIRWAKQRQIDISEGITAAQAQDLINTWALARDIIAGIGLDGGGNLSADITINLEDTAVTPDIYGDATNIPQITIDQQGRITSAVDIPISPSGSPLEIEDEGVSIETDTTKINFIGAGVTATSTAPGEVEVDIPGGGSPLEIEDEGVSIETDTTKINFIGAGVTATSTAAGEVEVDIPGGGGGVPEFLMATKNTSQDFPANTWTNTTFNTLVHNGITGASMTGGIINLPAGTYIIEGRAESIRSNEARLRLRNNTAATTLCSGMGVYSGSATGTGVGAFAYPSLFGKFTLAAASDIQVQQFIVSSSGAFTDNGFLGDTGALGFNNAVQEFKITKIA